MIKLNDTEAINLNCVETIEMITQTEDDNGNKLNEPHTYTYIRFSSGVVKNYKEAVGRAILKQFPVFEWWKIGKEE